MTIDDDYSELAEDELCIQYVGGKNSLIEWQVVQRTKNMIMITTTLSERARKHLTIPAGSLNNVI